MDGLLTVLSNTLVGAAITMAAAVVAGFMIHRRPGERAWWEDFAEKPGLIVGSVTFGSNLAASLPRLVWEPGEFVCDVSGCTVVGGGQRVEEGSGFGAFIGDLVLAHLIDVPIAALGLAVGVGLSLAGRQLGALRATP